MAIQEFSRESASRAKIAFVGGMPQAPDLIYFEIRGFECVPCTSEDFRRTGYAAQLDAVIWSQDPKKLNTLPRELVAHATDLLNHDVRIYIRLATDENRTDTPRRLIVNSLINNGVASANLRPDEWQTIPWSQQERENSFLMPCVFMFEAASSWANIAAIVCDRPAGPSPKAALKIDEKLLRRTFGDEGHTERLMLLKRAFWNCAELQLTLLDSGMSGAPVFRAFASLAPGFGLVQPGATGAYPHLYFVKIGSRKKIVDEYDKYCSYIVEYVPFHLGPRLRRDRCNLGATQGIIVGDFVESAESLITCARGARCGHAISNLFEKTLGGWRKQMRLDTDRSLGGYLERRWYAENSGGLISLPSTRAELVRQLGGHSDTVRLKELFEQLGNTLPFTCPAHGDMHAANVLVRHSDAILIDFEKLEEHYPVTYDPASLEGGFLVEGFIDDLKARRFKPIDLVKLIEPLYKQAALINCSMTLCRRGDPAEWYYDAINQIRALSWAAENESGQYALTLGLCLIRKGCNPHQSLISEAANASRAIAFVLGERILRQMAGDL